MTQRHAPSPEARPSPGARQDAQVPASRGSQWRTQTRQGAERMPGDPVPRTIPGSEAWLRVCLGSPGPGANSGDAATGAPGGGR